MTRLIHLTDLHFGAERPDLVDPLARAIKMCNADFIAVSGDLSHRARPAQFRAAMAFVDALGMPFMTVPGNHDLPFWNLPLRFLAPFRPWRAGVRAQDTNPVQAGRFRLFGANTADPFRWRSGVLRARDVTRIAHQLQDAPPRINVLVCHHPIEEPPGFDRGETRHAASGIARLNDAGISVVLSGHLHHWDIGLGISADNPRPLLQIQSGTALCGRLGESAHGFAVLDATDDTITVTRWIHDDGDDGFVPRPPDRFRYDGRLWARDDGNT